MPKRQVHQVLPPGAPNRARDFLIERVGCPLKAWMHYIDENLNNRVDFDEFCLGMKAMNFEGDVVRLWKDIDEDGYDELTLDEIDHELAILWASFRQWCATRFESSMDMVGKAGDGTSISNHQFCHRLPLLGWQGGEEQRLFDGLCTSEQGVVTISRLRWLDAERRRNKRKEAAKAKAGMASERRGKERLTGTRALKDFKSFLIKKYGSLFHAWRKLLDIDGSMSVQKKELFRTARESGWNGNVRALWKALDRDGSGVTALEELDLSCAHELAQFKAWAEQTAGSPTAAFKAIDRSHSGKLKVSDFASACEKVGLPGGKPAARCLFHLLDWECKRRLTQADFACLDHWHPPRYLTSTANHEAAEDFKRLLLKKYRHPLKAWRSLLDRDGSNRVSWGEFEEAARKVGFRGDIPGAWLDLDSDLSGFITLREISPTTVDRLLGWKSWADAEMGSVRAAFKILDADNSGSLTKQEFRRACQDFGFVGDCRKLFMELDCSRGGTVSLNEVTFLDDWQPHDEEELPEEETHMQSTMTSTSTMSSCVPSIPDVAALSRWYSMRLKARIVPGQIGIVPHSSNQEAFSALAQADISCKHSRLASLSDKVEGAFTQLRSPYATLSMKTRSKVTLSKMSNRRSPKWQSP